ncbi:MAG: PorV/PorQ family protein [Longimicrobiales bacterium]|nr:PorV/PorQ family protein [Longimicrobiales bacterium]
MMPRPRDLLIVVFALLASTPGLTAQSDAGPAEGAIWLLLPVGARGVSMARAMTWTEGPEGAFWNPAGLAGLQRSQGVVLRGEHATGPTTAASILLTREGLGTLGVSYFLLDAGTIDQRDRFGNYTGTITIRDHLGVVSAATRLAHRLDLGVNFKVIRFQFSCRGLCANEGTTATTYAVDAGVQSRPTSRLRLGAMVAHVGPALQVRNAEQSDPLPARVRVAAAYDVLAELTERENLQGWLAFEVQDRLRDLGSLSYYLGTELTAGRTDALSLRAGYVWAEKFAGEAEQGGRVGLGLQYERFELDIAKSLAVSPLAEESEAIHVTFSIGF